MSPPSSIAHFRIVSKLDEGGMGAVYRATDTKLNRDVAIKILPESFASDTDRLARFAREAQVLASLNHPNIAAIYGVEERALVMELVEGSEPRGPMEDPLPIIQQLIDALEYAHEKGVVHRDLKPANLKLTADGRLKVLDFGLAKAMAGDAGAGDPMSSPTLTMRDTVAGTIIGTAAYMSPEQARGQNADKRADIWSFGAVVYELLIGKRLFEGATVSDTLASVLRQEIDFSVVSTRFRRLLRRCLERDPKRRLRDIGDARAELGEVEAVAAVQPARRSGPFAWIVAAVFVVVSAALVVIHFREAEEPRQLMRFSISPPEKGSFGVWLGMSPDGRHLGFVGSGADGIGRIWLRSMTSLDARPLAGTEAAVTFFWSPDSRQVVFQSGNKLKKVDISGGPAQTLCDVNGTMLGGAWGREGVILFGTNSSPIMRVSEGGGIAVPITRGEDAFHSDPVFLPDGRHFLYLRRSHTAGEMGVYAGSLDLRPEQQSLKRIQETAFSPGYAPPRPRVPGYLLFVRDASLMAQPFDERHLETIGEAVAVVEHLDTLITRALFSVSLNGILVYSASGAGGTQLSWYDRFGHLSEKASEPGDYTDLAISPDATRVAYSLSSHDERQVWTRDFQSTSSRVSLATSCARRPYVTRRRSMA